MNLPSTYLSIILITSLSACSLISPLVINYNGVRRDVATYINNNMRFSLSDRRVLVYYAKQQQEILSKKILTPEEQVHLAQKLAEVEYCSSKKVSLKKLNLVNAQIFALDDQQAKLKYYQALQAQQNIDFENIDCSDKY